MLRFDIFSSSSSREFFRQTALEKRTELRKTRKSRITVPGLHLRILRTQKGEGPAPEFRLACDEPIPAPLVCQANRHSQPDRRTAPPSSAAPTSASTPPLPPPLLIPGRHQQRCPTPLSSALFQPYGITVIPTLRFHFDARKSERLRANPKRGIGFEEVQEIFAHPHYLDQRGDFPEQFRAIGWVGERLYSVIFEIRQDAEGEFLHLVTLWKSTSEERKLYHEHL